MNLFETETWRAFFPNFIAVVASIVLTFGTDRAIQEYNHRQDIREVIAVLKADARESFEYYRETADNCRRICASTDRIVRAGDRYDTLPPEMLGKFLTLLLEKNVFTSTSASEDILKQSGTMQYMEPELLSSSTISGWPRIRSTTPLRDAYRIWKRYARACTWIPAAFPKRSGIRSRREKGPWRP